jgi:signal transduction histidine kinase
MDEATGEIIATLNIILAKMATKDDIARMATKDDIEALRAEMHEAFVDIRSELKDIRQRLDALESAVQNITGYAKEIDHLIERVSAIEKHLGLRANISA